MSDAIENVSTEDIKNMSIAGFTENILAPLAGSMCPYDEEEADYEEEVYVSILSKAEEILDIFSKMEGTDVDLKSYAYGLLVGCSFGIRVDATYNVYQLLNIADNKLDVLDDEEDE